MFKGCVNAKGKFAIHSKIKTNLSATAVESRKIKKEDFYWSSQISGSQKTKYGSLLMKFEIPLGVSDLSGNLNILRLQKCNFHVFKFTFWVLFPDVAPDARHGRV